MNIETVVTSICQTNTYIIINDGEAIVIDPGDGASTILSYLKNAGAQLKYVLITHCHFDHIGAVRDLATNGVKVIMSAIDYDLLRKLDFKFDLGFGFDTAVTPFDTDISVNDGDTMELCGLSVRVIATPGHTPGGVSYLFECDGQKLFSGDTLFCGGVGRTDFPYCDESALCQSINRLLELDDDCTVYPGHGEFTTIGDERACNRYAGYVPISSNTELFDVARLFFGDVCPIAYVADFGKRYDVLIGNKHYVYSPSKTEYEAVPPMRRTGRLIKIALYEALKAHTGREMPWGALTGVRPTKLFYECVDGGKSPERAQEIMQSVYRVSERRASILTDIYNAQKDKVRFSDEYVNLYVHIPYCKTRCNYCSFVSAPINGGKCNVQVDEYIRLLCDEIRKSVMLIDECGKKILSVYIGGGTPTAISANQLDSVLTAIGNRSCEYTCEAGRPDTIDERKIEIMKKHGVTRVCVNPQTLCEKTLEIIGRGHNVDMFYGAYDIVKRYGFDVNCDLIAGLAGETVNDFARSYNGIVDLSPQNITVHSLSKKNGSSIRYDNDNNEQTALMTEYALNNAGVYKPYYLYRQKRQSGNLENIGFSIAGKECINNITTMEETVTVAACGAGAISKIVDRGDIVRFANMRDIKLYIERYEEELRKKFDLFKSKLLRGQNS